ncbi:MAG: allophanate hydrolase, partial [Thermoplasmata archaeon]
YNGLTEDDVIEIHSKPTYRVYMLGFTPGFAYMGGLDERIAAPRLETPRKKVPAGSVGIAGKQTGIYPIESPGGWRLIGRTPLKLFDPKKDPPTLLLPGDLVKFVPIDKEEFYRILKEESK